MKKLFLFTAFLTWTATGLCEITGVTTQPGSTNSTIQYNKRGVFGGDPLFNYSTSTRLMTAPSASISTLTSLSVNLATFTNTPSLPSGIIINGSLYNSVTGTETTNQNFYGIDHTYTGFDTFSTIYVTSGTIDRAIFSTATVRNSLVSSGVTQLSSTTISSVTISSQLTWSDGSIQKVGPGYLNVKECGAKGDGSTDDTSAIATCLIQSSTTKRALLFPAGTYMVTSTNTLISQVVMGMGKEKTIIKRASGASNIFTITSSANISGMTLDGNSLPGTVLISSGSQRATYRDIRLTNVAGTSYALIFWTGDNEWITCEDLEFYNNYGNIWIQTLYYSSFYRTKMFDNTYGYNITMTSTSIMHGITDIMFRDTYIQGGKGIYIGYVSGIRDLTFDGLRVRINSMPEPWWTSYFPGAGGETAQITIKNASFLKRVDVSTIPIFDVNSYQLFTENIHIVDADSVAGWFVIRDLGTKNMRMKDWTIESQNSWRLYDPSSTGGSYTTADSVNYTQGVVGTATWSNQIEPGGTGASAYITVRNSNLQHSISSANADVTDFHKGGFRFENINGDIDLTNTTGPVYLTNVSGTVTDPQNAVVGVVVTSATSNTDTAASGTNADIVQILLYPGKWNIWGHNMLDRNSATFTDVDYRLWISSHSGTSTTGRVIGVNGLYNVNVATGTFTDLSTTIAPFQLQLTVPATFYLKANIQTFTSGQPKNYGNISAERKP